MRYDKQYEEKVAYLMRENYTEGDVYKTLSNIIDSNSVDSSNKIEILKNEIKEYKHDLKVCEDEDLKLRDVIDEHLKFNHKHRYIIKVLKFVDKIKIKLPRVKVEWKR